MVGKILFAPLWQLPLQIRQEYPQQWVLIADPELDENKEIQEKLAKLKQIQDKETKKIKGTLKEH